MIDSILVLSAAALSIMKKEIARIALKVFYVKQQRRLTLQNEVVFVFVCDLVLNVKEKVIRSHFIYHLKSQYLLKHLPQYLLKYLPQYLLKYLPQYLLKCLPQYLPNCSKTVAYFG